MSNGRAQTNGRATPRPTHGDHTGNQSQALRKEHESAVREAQARMTTVSPVVTHLDADEIDEVGGEVLVDAATAQVQALEAEDHNEDLTVPGDDLQVIAMPRERVRRGLRSVSKGGEEDMNELVEVRFIDDFPEVTYGKNPQTGQPRVFNFEGNRRYRIPRHMATHFSDKEMLV